jgi:tetratricopeptide (TPR) repeat protein
VAVSGGDDVAPRLVRLIGDLLASLRRSRGLSQQALAPRIGYSRSAVACAETGHRVPARSFWAACDEALGAGGSLTRAYQQIAEERADRARERARLAEAERERAVSVWRGQSGASGDPEPGAAEGGRAALRARLGAGRGLDRELVAVFQEKVNLARVVDRRLGAPGSLAELAEQIRRMEDLARHALNPVPRKLLAGVIVDACALAGWQWLDQDDFVQAWEYYSRAVAAARESESAALRSYAASARAVVLLEAGEVRAAREIARGACASARGKAPRLLESWLAASYAETCAGAGDGAESLRAFERADRLLSAAPAGETPYLVFGAVHLARWRGSALVRLQDREAAEMLSGALEKLDPAFTRAETALRADLAQILAATGQHEAAAAHAVRARELAERIGSKRQQRRIRQALRGGAAHG